MKKQSSFHQTKAFSESDWMRICKSFNMKETLVNNIKEINKKNENQIAKKNVVCQWVFSRLVQNNESFKLLRRLGIWRDERPNSTCSKESDYASQCQQTIEICEHKIHALHVLQWCKYF